MGSTILFLFGHENFVGQSSYFTCCKCCRYAFQIVLQTKDLLQTLPSLVDINVPNGNHFTVCGDVHGQVITLYVSKIPKYLSYLSKFLFLVVVYLC